MTRRKLYPWHAWLRLGKRTISRAMFGSLETETIRRQFYTAAKRMYWSRKVSVSICDRFVVVEVMQ
jgi:hypothetical protein